MAAKEWVSFNQDMDKAHEEIGQLGNKGYIVVESYGNDFDMGNIYEYALGEDKEEVYKKHYEHIKRCEESKKIRQELFRLDRRGINKWK